MADCRAKTGKERLLEHYRRAFRTPENMNHYSPEDYELAERKYLKGALLSFESEGEKKSSRRTG